MIFKTLVECILKRTHDPDDSLSLNAMHTLTREIKYDLTQAFALSRPLVDRHENLFLESNSYFDFLLRISELPFYKDYYSRRSRPDDASTEPYDICELRIQLDNCRKQLSNCQRENEETKNERDTCKTQLDQCQTKLGNCEVALIEWQKKHDGLKIKLCSADEKVETLEEERRTLKENLNRHTHEINSLKERLNQNHDQLQPYQDSTDENNRLKYLLENQKQRYETECHEHLSQLNGCIETLNELQKNYTHLENQYQSIYKSAESLYQQLNLQNIQHQQLMLESETFKQYAETLHQIMINVKTAIEYNQKVTEPLQDMLAIHVQHEHTLITEPDRNAESSQSVYKCGMKAIESSPLEDFNNEECMKRSDDEESMIGSDDDRSLSPITAKVLFKKDNDLERCKQLLETSKEELAECLDENKKYMKLFQEKGQYESLFQMIKTRYVSAEISDSHTLTSALEYDFKMADTFKSQIAEFEKNAHFVSMPPDQFAEHVLTQYLNLSNHAEKLREISEVAALKDDENFVRNISDRLKVYDNIMRLSNRYFPPDDVLTWILGLDVFLETLKNSLKDIDVQLPSDSPPQVPSDNPMGLKHTMLKISTIIRHFKISDAMINDMIKLLPDITEQMDTDRNNTETKTNVTNKCEFKNELVKRYTILKDFARSLLGAHPVENLSSLMMELQTKSKIEKDNWLYEYIQVLEKKSSLAFDLEEECQKVASHFKISFDRVTFSKDVVYQTIKLCDRARSVDTSALQKYFKLENITYNLLTESIITVLKGELVRHNIPVLNFDPASSDFQTLVDQVMQAVVDHVAEQKQYEWVLHYNQWVRELNLDTDTPKEKFLIALQSFKYREKRSLYTSAEDECVEKKVKLEDNWTHLEMQNLFAALYTEYFTLKWKYVSKIIPMQEEIQETLERKMALLDTIQLNPRVNVITKCLIEYAKVDLLLWNAKPDLFPELVSLSQILKTSMKQTEEYLLKLMNKDHCDEESWA